MTTRPSHLVVDSNDPARLSRFWADGLGWDVVIEGPEEIEIAPADGRGHPLNFVHVTEPKAMKNRVHLDLASASVEQQSEIVSRFRDLGAEPTDVGQGDAAWVVLSDLEGNEFCVSPPGFTRTGRVGAVTFDVTDPEPMARFWSAATGWTVVRRTERMVALRGADDTGPYLLMLRCEPSPPPKVSKNRWHLDVRPPADGDLRREADRLVELGAARIDIGQRDVPWVVLADPEENEFCVLTPRSVPCGHGTPGGDS